MRRIYKFHTSIGLTVLLACLFSIPAAAQYSYVDRPAIEVLEDLRQRTSFRFLYREAMLADISLTMEAQEDSVLQKLASNLAFKNISVKVDSSRKQVILYQMKKESRGKNVRISGQVIDASTGERLPFATISWKEGSRLRGVTSNTAGAFNFRNTFTEPTVTIRASYVGYAAEKFEVDLRRDGHIQDLTLRLEPTLIGGREVVVTGMNYYTAIDTSLQKSVDIGMFSPLGETNTIRALQQLPAVNINTALEDGINIRGSASDGFQILIDDITIYNQSHLFGLIDSFNADALKTSAFFYDITPAQYQAPPGGTLSLQTKTGSLNDINGSVGISNSSYRLTLEGPIKKGTSSWLISGRNSYMNTVNWLNNAKLIEWGLNVNRPREILGEDLTDIESQFTIPGASDATFSDLHGKLYFEGQSGSRFILSGYYGEDKTDQRSRRPYRTFNPADDDHIELRPVDTKNNWSNLAGSVQYQVPLSSGAYSYTSAGVSIYDTDFLKEAFSYIQLNGSTNTLQLFTFPFENRSILNEIKAEQQFDLTFFDLQWTLGGSYHYYYGEYFEDSFDRPGFLSKTGSHLMDTYAQVDITSINYLDIFAGTRLHYYSNGNYFKWSPRLKAELFPDQPVSASVGYSKNYQFLNEVSLSNVMSSDIWVLANKQQPPAAVDYYSAGLYVKPFHHTFLQMEGYIKDHENMRLHEINAYSVSNTFAESPWFYDNSGRGKGVEFFMKNQLTQVALSQSFTISKMQIQNPVLNDGDPFYVDWDRRYRYSATLEVHPVSNFSLYLSWMYATGNPNKLAVFGPDNEQRLDDYRRTDASIEYDETLSFGDVKASVSLYNVFDRNNPWYRELTYVLDKSDTPSRFRRVPVDVYDLGIQPAFNLAFSF